MSPPQSSLIAVRIKRESERNWRREFTPEIEAEALAACRAAEWPMLEGQSRIWSGAPVVPSRRLKSYGPSAIDGGGVVTRRHGPNVWVRPLKSTRPRDIGAKGFGWLWSSKKEYHLTIEDVERAEPDSTGILLRRLNVYG